MGSPEILDFASLLKPIAGEFPAGASVRYEGVYDAIQEARREDDALPMGEWQREFKLADWRAVINLSAEAIAEKSKDLQIGAWLVEALVKGHGFAGLRDGLRLLRELQEHFWDGLFPEADDGDLDFRAGPLSWLNEKLPASIHEITMTEGEGAYNWNHWDESRMVDNLGRQNPEAMEAAIAEGKITGEQFDKAVQGTPRDFYENLFEDLNQTREELTRLEKTVDQRFSPHPPSMIKIRNSLDDCHGVVQGILKRKREQDPNYKTNEQAAADGDVSGAASDAASRPTAVGWAGEPRSREEAFQRLGVLAAYLKRVEPQHPVSYLLERAVSWTKMPLEQWLGEVISNQDVLNQLRETLGIKDRDKA